MGPGDVLLIEAQTYGPNNGAFVPPEWDQAEFDPITHHVRNYIHFEFSDGSRMNRVFHYDWRLWSIPELRDLLKEAGFQKSEVYWEGTDRETGDGNDIFSRRERALDDPAWIAYIAAIRRP